MRIVELYTCTICDCAMSRCSLSCGIAFGLDAVLLIYPRLRQQAGVSVF